MTVALAAALAPGGMFVNIDVVRPSSEQIEQYQFRMWVDWINQTLRELGRAHEVGKHDGLPGVCKAKAENQCASNCPWPSSSNPGRPAWT